MLIFACLGFGACDFSFVQTTKTIEVSGTATYQGQALQDVSIKTQTQTLCKTNSDGKFAFTVNANQIEIFAEKSGFSFSPRKTVITENTANLAFVAQEVETLDGEIELSSICITPTSIVSIPDNFKYTNNNTDCLKLKNLQLKISNHEYQNFVTDKSFAKKHQGNTYSTIEEHSIKTDSKFSIMFSLSAYFTANGNEFTFTETRSTTLNVAQVKTTAHLNDNGQFEVSLYGINSSNNMFSYDITFVFDYYPNI